MINKAELCKFLVAAKRATYAAGDDAKKIKEEDGSTSLFFVDGDYEYRDNYFGGEPFGGREVVFYQGQPIYIMTYYGAVALSVDDFKPVYNVLQAALKLLLEDHPYRGPREYIDNEFVYKNSYTGEAENFFGEEIICDRTGKIIYQARYSGGLVDQR